MPKAIMATATAVVCLWATTVAAQHHTLRFFTSFGTPIAAKDLAFSPDGKTLAISTADGKTSLVATSSGEILHQHNLDPFSMTFTADGGRLFMLSTRDTQLWDMTTKQVSSVRWNIPPGYLGLTLEIRSGKLLVKSVAPGSPVAESDAINVGDELLGVTQQGRRRNLLGQSVDAAIAAMQGPLGTPITLHVVSAGQMHPSDVVLRRRSAQRVDGVLQFTTATLGASAPRVGISFNAGNIVVLDAADGDVLSVITPVELQARGQYAVSPDGRYLGLVASVREGRDVMGVEIYDVAKQERIHYAALPERSYLDAGFSPDGKNFLVGSVDRLQAFSLDTGKFAEPFFFSWRPPKKSSDDHNDQHESEEEDASGGSIGDIAPSVRKSLALGSSSHRSPRALLSCFDISPNGVVALGTPDGEVDLWSWPDGKRIHRIPAPPGVDRGAVESIALSHDAAWLSYYMGGTLYVISVAEETRPTVPAEAGN